MSIKYDVVTFALHSQTMLAPSLSHELALYHSYKLKIMRAAKKVSVIARAGSGMLCRLNRDLLSLKMLQVKDWEVLKYYHWV